MQTDEIQDRKEILGREIPFRPKLEGIFRYRFYEAVSNIHEGITTKGITDIIAGEIEWVQNECQFNLDQRKRYRAVLMLLNDLIRACWYPSVRDGVLYLRLKPDGFDGTSDITETKESLRSFMRDSRFEAIVQSRQFITQAEERGDRSIKNLIADGAELAGRLEQVLNGSLELNEAVRPCLQLVEKDKRDEFTGLKLSDIWRYFRLTWSTPARTTPGRTMQYLIRDAAHPMHAVMGIISLENSAVQITCRDSYIGWEQDTYIDRIKQQYEEKKKADPEKATDSVRDSFNKLLEYIETGISGIDYSDLCSDETVRHPGSDDVELMRFIAESSEEERQKRLKEINADGYEIQDGDRSELGRIPKSVENALYRRKRAEQMGNYLNARMVLQELLEEPDFDSRWQPFCESEQGKSVIRCALLAQKTRHIGSSILELNVCGAVPPYNNILGGKLAALLALSPQVIHDYRERYQDRESMIASRLKGASVVRPADLVYVGTTSLYYIGSSQYNRLKIPGKIFDSDYDVVWKQIGYTCGYGTVHISKLTRKCLIEAISTDMKKINNIFGEGTSPMLRLLNSALRELFESTNEEVKDLTKHEMKRIVYGACLASNTKAYLLGEEGGETPEYYADTEDYEKGTQTVIDYWTERWLKGRLNFSPALQRIRDFKRDDLLVSRELREYEEGTDSESDLFALVDFNALKEASMPVSNSTQGLEFIRGFYRGSSAYADKTGKDRLSSIHLKTRLDAAVIEAAGKGMDVVLTGNPGDGKTHLIRVLEPEFERRSLKVTVELDASTLSNEEIHARWQAARDRGSPFILAINAAVLHSLQKECEDGDPAKEAYRQMVGAVTYHSSNDSSKVPAASTVAVFDLSKREILTPEILCETISKLTSDEYYTACSGCPVRDNCPVQINRTLLNSEIFQNRLYTVLQRVSFLGCHATLRELQGFVSYLIFGNRTCRTLARSAGKPELELVSLIYSGKGSLFDAIRSSFDPARISHPIIDEKILMNAIDTPWVSGVSLSAETIAYDNTDLFDLRKRQYYFLNESGDSLLSVLDDSVTEFQQFLLQPDKRIVKELIPKLNSFFNPACLSSKELQIWAGHRYNNDPRKVLISAGSLSKSEFTVGRPELLESMKKGIDINPNYIRLEKKSAPGVFLKVDYEMYELLNAAGRGMPVLFTESNLVKKVWRFMEQLSSFLEADEDSAEIKILDLQSRELLTVVIDRDEERYEDIRLKG